MPCVQADANYAQAASDDVPVCINALWRQIESVEGLLPKIFALLTEPKDVAHASAVSCAWRSDTVWEQVCEQNATKSALFRLFKNRPGCHQTWRQLYMQHMRADRWRAYRRAPAPERSEYLVCMEIACHDKDKRRAPVVLHSSFQELLPKPDQPSNDDLRGERLCLLTDISSASHHYWGYKRRELRLTVLLVRKKDSKVIPLLPPSEDMTRMEYGPTDISLYGNWWTNLLGDIKKKEETGALHKEAAASFRVIVLDEPVEHCKGRGPPECKYPKGTSTETTFQCSCGHVASLKDQPFRVTEWHVSMVNEEDSLWMEEDGEDSIYLSSVDDFLSALETPAATSCWL